MPFHPEIHHRRSIRLRDYDYTAAGAYFITICTFQRECLFGEVVDGAVCLNEQGAIVQQEWLLTGASRDYVVLDEFVVMPNHFHALIMFVDNRRGTACRALDPDDIWGQGTARRAPTGESFGRPVSGSLATVIRSFKSAVTKRINEFRTNLGAPVWQRNYYERIIRNQRELEIAREYVTCNPLRWADDENHPRMF